MAEVADGLHAVLIGIDAYPESPLTGCVNDVLGIGEWLVSHAGLPEERITRLVAGSGAAANDRAPTLANLRAALAELPKLGKGSRVLLYYSGHGAREVSDAPNARTSREAIVPVDAWPQGGGPRRLLWDFELNAWLRAVVEAEVHLTCVLDCCHAAGTMRDGPFGGPAVLADSCVRSAEVPGTDAPVPEAAQAFRGLAEAAATAGWAQIFACEASEVAREAGVGAAGERHGLLSRALLEALDAVPAERAHQILWSELWYPMLDRIAVWNPNQNPRLFEAWDRPLLGGPRGGGDVGLRVTQRTGDYLVHAGKIAGLDEGSELAVYEATPAAFPEIDSPEDNVARRGKLRVTAARGATADAVAIDGLSSGLPAGARARVIVEAPASRLKVRTDPTDAVVRDALAAAADRMCAVGANEQADVWLAQRAEGALVLGDACYSSLEPRDPRTLLVLEGPNADDVRDVLEHYRRYCEPLRMARRCRDLPNALDIEILDCSGERFAAVKAAAAAAAAAAATTADAAAATAAVLQDPDLLPVRSTAEKIPVVERDQPCCIRVANRSTTNLVVVGLLCCTCEGKVQWWGEQLIPALGRATYWLGGVNGNPFFGKLPAGRDCVYERVIAIGTTVAGTSFRRLELGRTFAAVLSRGRGGDKDLTGLGDPPPPPERWTGTIREVLFVASGA